VREQVHGVVEREHPGVPVAAPVLLSTSRPLDLNGANGQIGDGQWGREPDDRTSFVKQQTDRWGSNAH
jgi:hypothetical protein